MTPMFWMYVFFALFFAAVLGVMGWYELRRADRKRSVAEQLADSGLLQRHEKEARPSH